MELENNQIITISDLEGLTKLTYLSLDRNNISDITPLRPLVSLETLKLMANNIGTISFNVSRETNGLRGVIDRKSVV